MINEVRNTSSISTLPWGQNMTHTTPWSLIGTNLCLRVCFHAENEVNQMIPEVRILKTTAVIVHHVLSLLLGSSQWFSSIKEWRQKLYWVQVSTPKLIVSYFGINLKGCCIYWWKWKKSHRSHLNNVPTRDEYNQKDTLIYGFIDLDTLVSEEEIFYSASACVGYIALLSPCLRQRKVCDLWTMSFRKQKIHILVLP